MLDYNVCDSVLGLSMVCVGFMGVFKIIKIFFFDISGDHKRPPENKD